MPNMFNASQQLTCALAKLLGLEDHSITKITIVSAFEDPPVFIAEGFVSAEQQVRLEALLGEDS